MGFWSFFKRDKRKDSIPPVEPEQDLGRLIRNQNVRQRSERIQLEHDIDMLNLKAKKMQLENDIAEMEGDEPESIDGMLSELLQNAMYKKFNLNNNATPLAESSFNTQTTASVSSSRVDITDSHFEQIWEKIPAIQKPFIKMASQDQIRAWIKTNYPHIEESVVERAVIFVKNK